MTDSEGTRGFEFLYGPYCKAAVEKTECGDRDSFLWENEENPAWDSAKRGWVRVEYRRMG